VLSINYSEKDWSCLIVGLDMSSLREEGQFHLFVLFMNAAEDINDSKSLSTYFVKVRSCD
jgi:hypothetical protein